MIKHDREQSSAESLDDIWSSTWKVSRKKKLYDNIVTDENLRWKLKFAPCYGKFIEAGCGMGTYVLYFNTLGFNIHGIDISKYAIEYYNY